MRITNSLFLSMLIVTGTALLIAGCTKDNYTTKPQLSFKSVNSYNIPRGGLIEFNIEFRDKEGDVSDTLYIQNRTANCPTSDYGAPAAYKIPEFPTSSNLKGNFQIVFENGTNNTGNVIYTGNRCNKPDTTIFYFWIKDKAKNTSDTIRTDKAVIIQN
jgi:hypothetical protein